MTDTFNVTAAYDKASYNQGDTITVTISGGDVLTQTVTTQAQSGLLALMLNAADGSSFSLPMQPITVNTTTTTATPESVKLTQVTDSSGRVWTVGASGLSATAAA